MKLESWQFIHYKNSESGWRAYLCSKTDTNIKGKVTKVVSEILNKTDWCRTKAQALRQLKNVLGEDK